MGLLFSGRHSSWPALSYQAGGEIQNMNFSVRTYLCEDISWFVGNTKHQNLVIQLKSHRVKNNQKHVCATAESKHPQMTWYRLKP